MKVTEYIYWFFRIFSRIVMPRIVVVGIDVQDTHLSAVASQRKGDKVEVLGSQIVTVSEDAIEDGEVKNSELLREGILSLIKGMPKDIFERLKGDPVFVLSIPPHHVYTETITFPIMAEDDLEGAIKLKIETSLPWPAEKTYVDWVRVPTKEANTIGIFLAAVSKSTLDAYLNVFMEVGWKVSACEFHLMSLMKFASKEDSAIICASVDEDGIEFALLNERKMMSHYLVKIRPQESLSDALKDKMKQLIAFAEGNLGLTMSKGVVLSRSSFDEKSIQEELGLPIEVMKPDSGLGPEFLIAEGASERSYASTDSSLNLIPQESNGRYHQNLLLKTVQLWTTIFLVFTVTFLIALGGVWGLLKSQRTSIESENNKIAISFNEKKSLSDPLIAQAREFNKLISFAGDKNSLRILYSRYFSTLFDQEKKSGVAIYDIRTGKEEKTLEVSATAPLSQSAVAFKTYLDESKVFSSIDLPESQLREGKNILITLTLRL